MLNSLSKEPFIYYVQYCILYWYLFVKTKAFNFSELHFSEVTSYKIHTLEALENEIGFCSVFCNSFSFLDNVDLPHLPILPQVLPKMLAFMLSNSPLIHRFLTCMIYICNTGWFTAMSIFQLPVLVLFSYFLRQVFWLLQ